MVQETIAEPTLTDTEYQGFMHNATTRAGRLALWITNLGAGLRDYFGSRGRRRNEPVNDRAGLKRFLETRASYVAQTSLYSYLRTRAGVLYPQLFVDDAFIRLVNIAKWHVWLACLSDLSIYAGGLLVQRSRVPPSEVGAFMKELVETILHDTGTPAEAGEDFSAHAARVPARLASCDWGGVSDDETSFSESPAALVRWAPIVENLKELDEEIVKNSVRFRWQEIRRDLRRNLDAGAVLRSAR
jgi:hypothetical protein